jgi:hypothetical protein
MKVEKTKLELGVLCLFFLGLSIGNDGWNGWVFRIMSLIFMGAFVLVEG